MTSSAIEALYVFDHNDDCILEHVYRSRPAPPNIVFPLYIAHPNPRPSFISLNTSPPTLLFSLVHSNLIFLSPISSDIEPLFVLEFLHRVIDVLEEFLGSPLLASKIEASYDVVAQLLGEMCDAGSVCNTEPNALRDDVEVTGWMGKLLGGVGLPGYGSHFCVRLIAMLRTKKFVQFVTSITPQGWSEAAVELELVQYRLSCPMAPRQCSPY